MDSGVCVVARKSGTISYVSSRIIKINYDDGERDEYRLTKFSRSNQSNCYNQKPIVLKGDHVEKGQVIADGPSTSDGELALGKNPLIGFMTWENPPPPSVPYLFPQRALPYPEAALPDAAC